MSSRIETDIIAFRSTLEKSLANDGSQETFSDVITALRKIPITRELLKKTNIGQTLQEVKKKNDGNDIGAQTKLLLSKWKKDIETAESSAGNGETKSAAKSLEPLKTKPAAYGSTEKTVQPSPRGNDEEEFVDDSHYDILSPIRKKIMNLFVESFKLQAPEAVAKFLAFNVEASINKLHTAESDNKNYLNKARSLAFNLKKNERLRQDIVEGRLQAEHLAHLSTSELATEEVRGEREESARQADLARRGDLYEITRAAILKSNGIDPNKGGEFCCRRCKGTKTTHYALQTRSSDEPMTVFVCCLTCGNRWRCT